MIGLALVLPGTPTAVAGSRPPQASLHLDGAPQVVFDPARDGCDGSDVPDTPARLFRDTDGSITLFGLHYSNHPLKGPTLEALHIVCRSAFRSAGSADAAAYDDKSWLAATWTADGRVIDGLVHHEFQGDSHPGACRFPAYMQCWFNTVLAVRSIDGGASFEKAVPPVVASAPFPQSFDQGRHRGFFNPSNIVSDGRFTYFLASTTGWTGQDSGVCLFRTATPDEPSSWRAYDGATFSIRYFDPYRSRGSAWPKPCLTVEPFPAPVGSIVRQRDTGVWLAVFQAAAAAGRFPQSGFYVAASRDLLQWSRPHLLLSGTTNYEDPCTAEGRMLAYPTLVDPEAKGRNFDDVGTRAVLLFTSSKVSNCTITSDRVLMRQPVAIDIDRSGDALRPERVR